MAKIKLIRFISHEEMKIHCKDYAERLITSHFPTMNEKRWSGDSFGIGWCFFVDDGYLSNDQKEVIARYEKSNFYKLTITVDSRYLNVSARDEIGFGHYIIHGDEITVEEIHFKYIPWWVISSFTLEEL